MRVQFMLNRKNSILYKTAEIPMVNVGWEIYIKFDELPEAIYVKVIRVTVYAYKKAQELISSSPLTELVCNVKEVYKKDCDA